MAGKDPLKMDDVFNLPAREFMNALLLMKAMPCDIYLHEVHDGD
jgi:hypothetical protein